MNGRSIYDVRKAMGRELAREAPADADVIMPVPDSGVPAALGFAQASGIPYELGIIRNHYVGRTFIQPTQSVRELGVRLKHSANRAAVQGKAIVLVDDSLVRGTTSVKIVRMMREAGAREVHFRIASPPITHPDFYGIDTPEREKLLAATHDLEGMRAHIGADSLAFLSVDGLYRSMGEAGRDPLRPQFTDHCFTGDYPTPLTDHDLAVATPRRLSHARRSRLTGHGRSPSRTASRSSPAPRAASAAPRPWRSPRPAPMSSRSPARQGALEELDDAIRAAGSSATLVPVNLKDFDALDRLGAAIHERWGKLDVLLGNAGILGELAPITHIDQPIWDDVMAVNVTANYRLMRVPRPAPARLRCRPGDLRVVRRRPQGHRLLGRLRDLEGCARSLVRTYAAETATTHVRGDAGQSRARCAPRCAARPCRGRTRRRCRRRRTSRRTSCARPARLERDRQDLRFPADAS